jgi:hypothetical protein
MTREDMIHNERIKLRATVIIHEECDKCLAFVSESLLRFRRLSFWVCVPLQKRLKFNRRWGSRLTVEFLMDG